MEKLFLNRFVLCIVLIVFMYAAAACSISNDSKKISSSNKITNADKFAFAETATVIINAAEERYIIDSLENITSNCYTLQDLEEYVSFDLNKYDGVLINTKSYGWEIYLTDGTLTINGKNAPVSGSDVIINGTLSTTSCNF